MRFYVYSADPAPFLAWALFSSENSSFTQLWKNITHLSLYLYLSNIVNFKIPSFNPFFNPNPSLKKKKFLIPASCEYLQFIYSNNSLNIF